MLDPQTKATLIRNAPTFLDELADPEGYTVDVTRLRDFPAPLLLTGGSDSSPDFGEAIHALMTAVPRARHAVLDGAGHVPQLTTPDTYATLVADFALRAERACT